MRLAIGLFVFMIASCFGHIFATLLLAITIFILSFWTGVLFVKALRRNDGSVFAADELFAETAVKRLIVIVILVAMVSSTTIVFSLQAFEEIAKSVTTVSVSASCLNGIETGLYVYANDWGQPPVALSELVKANYRNSKNLIAPQDPLSSNLAQIPPGYSSYIYFPPGAEFGRHDAMGKVILLFESGEWHRLDSRIFGERCRVVRFESHAECLSDNEFRQALEEDRGIRRKLGWPVWHWNEKLMK